MNHIAISPNQHTGATFSKSDFFTPIGYGLEVALPRECNSGDEWLLHIEPLKTDRHLAHTFLTDNLFVASESEILSTVNGNLLFSPNEAVQSVVLPNTPPTIQKNFRSNMIEEFFGHIFVAKGRTLHWTDLHNTWEWTPHPHNEADFREFEWERFNISALVRLGDSLFVHFPNAFYEVVYTGKPTIIRMEAKVHGVGCVTPRALVAHTTIQFFLGPDNFYLWSPYHGLQVIGQDIWHKFIKDNTDSSKVWSFVNKKHNEICWVTDNFIWAFNFEEKHWQKYSKDSLSDQTSVSWTNNPLTINNSPADTDSVIEEVFPNMIENISVLPNAICRDHRGTEELSACVEMTVPFLESDDIDYGDLHFVKKVDLMMIDARGEYPWMGFKLEISGRDYVTEKPRWKDCGFWTQWLPGRQLDFWAVPGKVLKFRFTLQDSLNWNGILPNGGLSLDGKKLDIANGQIIMNGERDDFFGCQFLSPDGTMNCDGQQFVQSVNMFELNAFGERVDLPETLVGPDK